MDKNRRIEEAKGGPEGAEDIDGHQNTKVKDYLKQNKGMVLKMLLVLKSIVYNKK